MVNMWIKLYNKLPYHIKTRHNKIFLENWDPFCSNMHFIQWMNLCHTDCMWIVWVHSIYMRMTNKMHLIGHSHVYVSQCTVQRMPRVHSGCLTICYYYIILYCILLFLMLIYCEFIMWYINCNWIWNVHHTLRLNELNKNIILSIFKNIHNPL